jgi:hypothetical protein
MRQGIKRMVGLATAVTVLGLPAAALADWPMYGRDLANSRDAGTDGPSPTQGPALAGGVAVYV